MSNEHGNDQSENEHDHADHESWLADHRTWRIEHSKLLAGLRRVEAELHEHEAHLLKHEQMIAAWTASLDTTRSMPSMCRSTKLTATSPSSTSSSGGDMKPFTASSLGCSIP